MLQDSLFLIIGLGLLLGGGDILVRGASSLAKSLGVPPLVIGLTVVAFGTSAPELSINLLASFKKSSAISFGNIIGSNIANIALILGCSATIKSLNIESVVITREIPMMLLASFAALIMGLDTLIRGTSEAFYDRSDGLVLLLLFAVFIYYTVSGVIKKRKEDPFVDQAVQEYPKSGLKTSAINIAMIIGGLAALVAGGKYAVDGAVGIAEGLNVSKVVIGLTVVAVGTSLPELVTSLLATWRGQTELAVGNVVGSNIFNLLFVTGISSTIYPIQVPASGKIDLLMMAFLSLALLPIAMTNRNKITQGEGVFLLIIYVSYTAWRTLV